MSLLLLLRPRAVAPPATGNVTLTYVGAGTAPSGTGLPATGNLTATPNPPTMVDGDLVLVAVGSKPDTAGVTVSDAAWTPVPPTGYGAGGSGVQGAATGPVRESWYLRTKDPSWSAMPDFTLDGTGNCLWAHAYVIRADVTGAAYDVAMTSGVRTVESTAWTVACDTDPGFATGDMVLFGGAPTTTLTASAEAITAPGVTFATATEVGEPKTSRNNDVGGFTAETTVTAGTSTGAPTVTATMSAAIGATGVSTVVRVRGVAVTPGETHTGGISVSGTGSLSLAGAPQPSGTLATTGTGSLVVAGIPRPTGAVVASGSGTLVTPGTPRPTGALTVSGTGSFAVAGQAPTVAGALALTGDGVLTAQGSSAVSFADDFNRADGPLGGNWATTANVLTIVNGQVAGAAAACAARWVTPVTTGLQVSQATHVAGAQSNAVAVAMPGFADAASAAGPTMTWYAFRSLGLTAGHGIALKNPSSGTYTTLVSSTRNLAGGDVLRLEWDGTILSGYINGTLTLTHTPATPLAGQYVGIAHATATQNGVPILDDWSGGNVGVSTYSGTAGFSGTGSLTFGETATTSGALDLAGAGDLGLTGVAAQGGGGALALSGAGALSLAAAPSVAGVLATSGTGTLVQTGVPRPTGIFGLSGSGTLAPSGVARPAGALPLTGAGSVVLAGTPAAVGTLAGSGTGSLALSSAGAGVGILPLAGTGSLASVTTLATATGTMVVAGTGALSVSGGPSVARPLALAGTGTIVLSGAARPTGVLALAGTGAISLAVSPRTTGALALNGSGAVVLAGTSAEVGTGTLTSTGTGTVLFAGKAGGVGGLLLPGVGALTLVGSAPRTGGGMSVTGLGTLTVAPTVKLSGLADLQGLGTLGLLGIPTVPAGMLLAGTGTLELRGAYVPPFIAPRHPELLVSVGASHGEVRRAGSRAEILVSSGKARFG